MTRTTLSLFTSGGLGDLAVRQAGFDMLVSNEVLEDRHALFKQRLIAIYSRNQRIKDWLSSCGTLTLSRAPAH